MAETGEERLEKCSKTAEMMDSDSEKTKGYLVIDYGDKIRADFKFSQKQIQQQLQHLQREITLLWEIIRDLMILLGPMMLGWLGFFLSRMFFSRVWEGLWIAFNSFLMSACLVLFMSPLNEALVRLIAALDEFKDIYNQPNPFEDDVEEAGDGDAGHLDTTDTVNSDVDNIGTTHQLNSDLSDVEDDNGE